MVKVELGGGKYPRGEDWINVDKVHGVGKHRVDFDLLPLRLPFDDASVDELYSSHCLEHVRELGPLMREIVRVCKEGAKVEVRVPAPFSAMAMCHGHVQVIADDQVDHWCKHFVDDWFGGCERMLKHVGTFRLPGGDFEEAKALFPQMTDDQIMRFVPGTCHENRYSFEVIAR